VPTPWPGPPLTPPDGEERTATALQRFVAQWGVYVYIQRHPQLATELRRWEDTAESGDAGQSRRAASGIGRILDQAHEALGLAAGRR
jgi:hypothetical protein